MTANEMFERVQDYMDENGIKYEAVYDEERPMIKSGMRLDCKLKNTLTYFLFGDDGYSSMATINVSADGETMGAAMTYVTMANYGLRDGCFEMNIQDGDIRYRTFVASEMDELSDELIARSISLPIYMLERYGNGLLAVMMGFSDPITEIKKVEGNNSSDEE